MKRIRLYSIESHRNYRLSNNKDKDNILFKEIGFWSVFFTALLYANAYICERITAYYFGFDVDLISLPMSVIIKNSLTPFVLIAIALFIILPNVENNKKPTRNDANTVDNANTANTADNTKKFNILKFVCSFFNLRRYFNTNKNKKVDNANTADTADNTKKFNILKSVGSLLFISFSLYIYFNTNENSVFKISLFILGAIISLACGYFLGIKIIKSNSILTHFFVASNIFFIFSCFYIYILVSWMNLLLIIIPALLLSIWLCAYRIFQSDNILKSYYWLAGLFISLVGFAGASSLYLVIDNFKPDQSFKYNGQDYILLRNYDGNLVAKKITIIQQKKYCFNEGILYLPTNALKEELNLKEVNFIGNCNELSILKRRNFLNRF